MKKQVFNLFTLILLVILASCTKEPRKALIETDLGDITIMLYDSTPEHRDNFIKLVEENFYDSLLFHRVIKGFMIQGGDPQSKNAADGQPLGSGGPGYQITAEIGAPHIRGAVAAARNNNPEKKSSGSQFYIVDGKPIGDSELDAIEARGGFKYNPAQRELYKTEGGAAMLDGNYTVFGEVVEGMDVVDKIASVQKSPQDRPLENVRMKIRMIN